MKIPSTVQVGFKTYKIIEWHAAKATAANGMGECDRFSLEIRIRTDLPLQQVQNTLLHEVLHACWDIAELDRTPSEEAVVTLLSTTLLKVAQDNPKVIKFIFGGQL
jgi:hypothetical protein